MLKKDDHIIEVSKKQYNKVIIEYAGLIFHREENGKYFIKPTIQCSNTKLLKYLKDNE